MINFFYNDKFYSDLGELCDDLDLDDDAIAALPDDWSVEVTEATAEKLIELSPDWIVERIDDDRWPEENDEMYRRVKKLLSVIDFASINSAMPELYYETKNTFSIEKSDLVDEPIEPMKEGDYVHYTPEHGPKENGRIKIMGKEFASVVYKCAGEWDKFIEYTGARTEVSRLSRGWIDGDEPKENQP